MLKKHLLYNNVIESDGKIVREETFLGAMLAGIVLFTALTILVYFFF